MALVDNFFRHSCDIYFASVLKMSKGYGLDEVEKLYYNSIADLSDIPCFFTSSTDKVYYQEPFNKFDGPDELCLPPDIEISQGDRVVDKRIGHVFVVGFPEDIRGKYVSVTISKIDGEL